MLVYTRIKWDILTFSDFTLASICACCRLHLTACIPSFSLPRSTFKSGGGGSSSHIKAARHCRGFGPDELKGGRVVASGDARVHLVLHRWKLKRETYLFFFPVNKNVRNIRRNGLKGRCKHHRVPAQITNAAL